MVANDAARTPGESIRYELTAKVEADIDKRFTYHAPKGDQTNRYAFLRFQAREYARAIATMCPDSREKSLALTHLEEAVMWANAAIARSE